jgi:two-component system, NarL family, sensor histidine kinase DevS
MRQAIEDVELEIANLRAIIADLRPSLLDDVGLHAALEALLDRRRDDGLTIDVEIRLPDELADRPGAYRDLETTIYRLVQESLTNVVKHADARRVDVSVTAEDSAVVVQVSDNGQGFDTAESTAGFGVAGMRERVFLLGGTLTITSDEDGTRMEARIPLPATGLSSDTAQAVP